MTQKYGICTCHNKHNPINSRGLCPEGVRDRRESSAASKGIITKRVKAKNEEDGSDNTRGRTQELRSIQDFSEFDRGQQGEIPEKKPLNFKTSKIKPRSEKKKQEDVELARIKKLKIAELEKKCEMCGRPGEVDLFHIIGRGDKKYSSDPTNLLLSCRWCHNVWTANDWGKIIKFNNFQDIMDRLKSLNEGYYWKLKHKIDEYLQRNQVE